MCSAIVMKNLLKESAKIVGLVSILPFIFIDLICFLEFFFFHIYNGSYFASCSLGITFLSLKKR